MIRYLLKALDGSDARAEISYLLGAVVVLVFLGLEIFNVVAAGKPFDMQAFGVGVTATFSGVGLLSAMGGLMRKLQGDGPPPDPAAPANGGQ